MIAAIYAERAGQWTRSGAGKLTYLLGMDVLSKLFERSPSTTLIARLAPLPSDQRFTSSVTLGELMYEAYRLVENRLSE